MKKANALDLVNTLDSRYQSAQPLLRKLVRGQPIAESDIEALPSTFVNLLPIIRGLAGTDGVDVATEIELLDSFGVPLKPLFQALALGLEE